MADFEVKLSYEEILAENSILKNKCNELIAQNKVLEDKLSSLQNNQAYEICEYYNECRSLQQTTDYFLYDNIVDCGNALMDFNGCSDSIQSATDYKEFCYLAYGKNDNNSYSESDNNSDNN
jgi:hypothetical protein